MDAFLPPFSPAHDEFEGLKHDFLENTFIPRHSNQDFNYDLQCPSVDDYLGIGELTLPESNITDERDDNSRSNIQAPEVLDQPSDNSTNPFSNSDEIGVQMPITSIDVDNALPVSINLGAPTNIAGTTVPPTNIIATENGFMCSSCNTTVKRASDLRRHMLGHSPPQLDCPVATCDRKGPNGFSHEDKRRDHLRQKHKIAC